MKQKSARNIIIGISCIVSPLLDVQAGLTHRYKFKNDVFDSCGTLNGTVLATGTYIEIPQFTASVPSGVFGCGPTNSLRFGATDGTKKSGFTLSSAVVSTNKGSYGFWMNPNKLQSTDYIMSPLPATSGPYIRGYSAGSIALVAAGQTVTASMTTGAWHHVAVTWDNLSGTATLFVDGTSAGTASYTPSGVAPTTVRIGGFNFNNDASNLSQQYDGFLYDLQFYDYRLTTQDVSCLYLNPGTVRMKADFAYQEPAGLRIIPYNGSWMPKFGTGQMATWAMAREKMNLCLITRGMIRDMKTASSEQFTNILNFLRSRSVALDDMSMTLNGMDGSRDDQLSTYNAIADDIQYLYTNGVTVECIAMQSTMSKDPVTYGLSNRVDDAQHFANYIDTQLSARGIPLPVYGLTDASRAKGYSNWQSCLGNWADGMIEIGKEPALILQDFPAKHVLEIESPSALLEAMQYSQSLGALSGWWISGGDTNYTPATARNKLVNAAHNYLALSNAVESTDMVLFGDFHYIYSADTPDTVNGAPYTALEVFNEIYNEFQTMY